MRKSVLFFAFLLGISSLSGMSRQGEPNQAGNNYDDDGYWNGPGWYWGIYISNEDDYWRHYNEGRGRSGHEGGEHGHGGEGGGHGGHGGHGR